MSFITAWIVIALLVGLTVALCGAAGRRTPRP